MIYSSRGQVRERTHFDDAVTYCRTSRRPRKRTIEVVHFDDEVAAELLLGVRVRAVENLRLAVRDPHRGRGRTRLETVAALQHAGDAQSLRVRHISRNPLSLFGTRQP